MALEAKDVFLNRRDSPLPLPILLYYLSMHVHCTVHIVQCTLYSVQYVQVHTVYANSFHMSIH